MRTIAGGDGGVPCGLMLRKLAEVSGAGPDYKDVELVPESAVPWNAVQLLFVCEFTAADDYAYVGNDLSRRILTRTSGAQMKGVTTIEFLYMDDTGNRIWGTGASTGLATVRKPTSCRLQGVSNYRVGLYALCVEV